MGSAHLSRGAAQLSFQLSTARAQLKTELSKGRAPVQISAEHATQPVPCHSTQTTFLPDSLESKVCMPDYLAAREAESRRLSARAPPRGRTHVLERV